MEPEYVETKNGHDAAAYMSRFPGAKQFGPKDFDRPTTPLIRSRPAPPDLAARSVLRA